MTDLRERLESITSLFGFLLIILVYYDILQNYLRSTMSAARLSRSEIFEDRKSDIQRFRPVVIDIDSLFAILNHVVTL